MNDLQHQQPPTVVYLPAPKPPISWAKVTLAVVVAVVYWLWPLDVLPGLPLDDIALAVMLLRWAGVIGGGDD